LAIVIGPFASARISETPCKRRDRFDTFATVESEYADKAQMVLVNLKGITDTD
jgi:hypothetical protein